MSIVTLTTDFGMKAHFVGAVKGALLREIPGVNIVDISHNISPFNVIEAAYVIQNAYSSFWHSLGSSLLSLYLVQALLIFQD